MEILCAKCLIRSEYQSFDEFLAERKREETGNVAEMEEVRNTIVNVFRE